jgi:hypothetical protein
MPTELRRADRRTTLEHCHDREEVLRGSFATIGAPCDQWRTATVAVRSSTEQLAKVANFLPQLTILVDKLLAVFLERGVLYERIVDWLRIVRIFRSVCALEAVDLVAE